MTFGLTRRRFLALAGGVAASTGLSPAAAARALLGSPQRTEAAAALTTLAEALRPGLPGPLGYRPVVGGPGEPHLVRDELAAAMAGRAGRRRSLGCFAHLTDQHVADVESPARFELFDRYGDGCGARLASPAFRPHEAASARIADAMLRRLRRVAVSPVTGTPITAVICTGDNTDNSQSNELDVFLAVMDGLDVTPQSGDVGRYEGVQVSGDPAYWHPDPAVGDFYKARLGFPARPGFLEAALAPFRAAGAGVPWYTCYGNHDGLVQGNVPPNPVLQQLATGGVKLHGAPSGLSPCYRAADLTAAAASVQPVTPDARRRHLGRREWVARHLRSPGLPRGHGFGPDPLGKGNAYYAADVGSMRWVVLDTVNPGGGADGSIGERQLRWVEDRLDEADRQRRLVLLFSHHGLRSLHNPVVGPDPLDPAGSDLPRHHGEEVKDVVSGHRCLVAWVNGHTHVNTVISHGTFWEIGTAAHVDWPGQSRLVEVVDNRDGTLSLFTTMVDHEGGGLTGLARELSGNDPQRGFGTGTGGAEDRNTELLLVHPFPGSVSSPGRAGDARPASVLPETGGPTNLTIGGAIAVAGALGLTALTARPGPTTLVT